jgi:hypothetical protein
MTSGCWGAFLTKDLEVKKSREQKGLNSEPVGKFIQPL